MKLSVKHQVLLLAMVPTLVISALCIFISTHSQNLEQALIPMGIIFLLSLALSGLYALRIGRHVTQSLLTMAGTTKALENAQTELQNKIDQATLSLRRTLETIEVQNIELEIARRSAENANKIKSEFLADMSHEIRTPLNGVVGFINLLNKTELNSKQREYAATIQKSANNLLAIINDILDFSKIEAGKLQIERTAMNVRECVEEILNLLAPNANEKNVALIPLVYSEVPSHVLGDPLRIKQIITNLVNNAIKFTEHGSVIVRVMLEQENFSQLTLRFSVTDTGIGLSPEEQKILFQAFNQTKASNARKVGGTGLGLVICKKLVEQMGGNIHVESEPHKGSTFWFTCQVEKHSGAPSPSFSELPSSSLVSSTTDAFKTPLDILAVDDNPENLKLITILLEDLGMHVTAVNSGEASVEAVREKPFHLILMDIRMPTMNGIEASNAIRNIEVTSHRPPTPIVALTAHALISEKKALLAAGIDDYLSKPIGEPELKAMIQKWIKPLAPRVIDWEMGKKLAGGRPELAKEFFAKLIRVLPQDKALINEDFLKREWSNLREDVHKLHGACCYCGVPELKRCAQKLESAVASHAFDIIKPRLDALNLAIDAVLAEAEATETEAA